MFLQSPFKKKDSSDKIAPVPLDENMMEAVNNDVEAQILVKKSPSVTNFIISNTFNLRLTMVSYTALVLITLCAMLVPLFGEVARLQNISNSIFGDALRTSTRLVIMESISIGCTLPTLSDVFLDRVTNNDQKIKITLSMWHRILFLLAFTIAGLLYISLSDYYFMAYLYIVLTRSKVIIVGVVTCYTVSHGTIMNSSMSKIILLIPVVISAIRFIFETYSLIYPEYLFLSSVTSVLEYFMFISFFGVQILWYYLLWRRYRVNKTLNNEEKKEGVFMLAMLFYLVACQVSKILLGWPKTWAETGGNALAGYVAVQIVCILLATVLPARFMRKVVQMSEAILQLKREFVRYVSHEIRSPLNVVHAGLELLRADLAAAGALPSTLRLLQDIYFASSAAIEILNDMLHYEHIDSGTFKLECATVSVLQAFAGRLDGFKFMVANKNITLHIEDQAQVSEFHSIDESQEAAEGLVLPFSSHSSPPPAASSMVLFIDRFRVEQIIRNLMTNAVKFTPEGGDVTIRFLACSEDLQHQEMERLDDLSPETAAGFSVAALAVTKNFLRIEVQDSGVGIAIEDQPEMFKQFAQFNRNALQGGGGSGLGLWICKNLATYHGGRLGFHSEGTGKGTTFFVDLPILSLKENPFSAASSNSFEQDGRNGWAMVHPAETTPRAFSTIYDASSVQEQTVPLNISSIRILIVDDSSINRKMIRRMLESPINTAALGEVIVEEADDGTTALTALRAAAEDRNSSQNEKGCIVEEFEEERALGEKEDGSKTKKLAAGFDLVFIDYVMTTMNGPEAVQIMRRDLKFAGGIIGVTGNALPADLTYFQECGVDLAITKPLTNRKLMDAILSVTQTKNNSNILT